MLNLISRGLVHFFIKQNAITKEDEEVYLYGTELIVSMASSVITTLIITLLFSQWYYFFIFFIFFLPLRRNAGGYHAESYGSCYLTTVLVYSLYILLIKYASYAPVYTVFLSIVFWIFTVFKYAPLIHKNNVITQTQINTRKFVSRLLITVYSLIVLLLLLFEVDFKLISAISLTILIVAFSIIFNILKKGGKKNEKVNV